MLTICLFLTLATLVGFFLGTHLEYKQRTLPYINAVKQRDALLKSAYDDNVKIAKLALTQYYTAQQLTAHVQQEDVFPSLTSYSIN